LRSDICSVSHETTVYASIVADAISIGRESEIDSIVRDFLSCHRQSTGQINCGSIGHGTSAHTTRYRWSGKVTDYRPLIEKYAKKHGIPPEIVYGVCVTESTLNHNAFRYEPDYRWTVDPKAVKPPLCSTLSEEMLQKTSLGIMQVMGATFREQGFTGWLPEVFGNVHLQFEHGCRYLAKQIRRFGSVEDGIAAYNAGRPVRVAGGRYVNQEYVDKVLENAKGWV